MKRHRTIRSDRISEEIAAADQGPVLDRRRFLTFAALGTGAAVTSFGLAKYVVNSDGASSAAAATATGSSAAASTSSSSTSTTAATSAAAAEVSDEVAYGMGDVATDNLTITVADGYRTIVTRSYPDHDIDASFRYPGTPAAQDPGYTYKVTTDPQIADEPTFVQTGQVFGVHLDSVVFDPKTAGYYNNDMSSGWNYVATADQLDAYGAHTRPETGFYHYHAVTDQWISEADSHSALVAWAADGFPVYLRYGYTDPTDPTSGVTNLASSYRLQSGTRPSGSPGGTYDGTYVADYEYVEGLGDLDECNGRECVTPEFPDGTYAYFLTDEWPWVPTYLRGTPDDTFAPGFGGGSGLPQ